MLGQRLSRGDVNTVDTDATDRAKNAARMKCHAGNVTPGGVNRLSNMKYAYPTVRVFGRTDHRHARPAGGWR